MNDDWNEGTVWLKSTDKNGGVSFTEHRCWHMEWFVQRTHRAASDAGGAVEQITRAEYREATTRDRGLRR